MIRAGVGANDVVARTPHKVHEQHPRVVRHLVVVLQPTRRDVLMLLGLGGSKGILIILVKGISVKDCMGMNPHSKVKAAGTPPLIEHAEHMLIPPPF